jgi:hypothetical protein
MYFELRAPDQLAMEMAYWDAQITGLDPEAMNSLTFNIGTGSIEKVTRLREKHNLELIHESDSEPTGYRRN